MRKTVLPCAALVFAFSAGLAGCAQTTGLEGTYRLTSVEEDGESATAEEAGYDGATLRFTSKSDGKSGTVVIAMGEDEAQEASFTLDGTALTLVAPEGEESLKCVLEGEKISCSEDSMTMVFTKST
ncbi:MAG: hypothetical protein LBK72_06055 [Bifidobacteriaceae bacterium]|nr:hypothetical protein [Bifidobacteriaceae bacterium]